MKLEQYPWQRELIQRESSEEYKAEQMRRIKEGHSLADDHPFPEPRENLIKFAKFAKDQPEIWDSILATAKRVKEVKEKGSKNVEPLPDPAERQEFFSSFASWYLMKHSIDRDSTPYDLVSTLLVEVALGNIKSLDGDEAMKFLRKIPFVEGSVYGSK